MTLGTVLAEQLPDSAATDLAQVLEAFVADFGATLENQLVSVLLSGSFALGAGDVHSDVDLVVVVREGPSEQQRLALQALHEKLVGRGGWRAHLEVSYVSTASLSGTPGGGEAWLYVDNGSTDVVWSRHDDNLVTRWILRSAGVPLVGPDGGRLVPAIPPGYLRREAVAAARARVAALINEPAAVYDDAWLQPYLVATFCRLLMTVQTDRVLSKIDAMQQCRDDLIAAAIANRANPWERVGRPGAPKHVALMPQFVAAMMSLIENVSNETTTRSPLP
jgi:predicted nucleotidyltransferase